MSYKYIQEESKKIVFFFVLAVLIAQIIFYQESFFVVLKVVASLFFLYGFHITVWSPLKCALKKRFRALTCSSSAASI